MAETTTTTKDYINQMYDANLESQKQTLQQDYNQAISDLDAEQKKAQKQTDQNLTRTYVEAARGAKNFSETARASGLTSGAYSQAALAQTNQLNANLTSLRGVQQEADAQIERERTDLAAALRNEIAKAQADNDMHRAEALYQYARDEEQRLNDLKPQIANLYAEYGDYSYLKELYNLSDQEYANLMKLMTPAYSSGTKKNDDTTDSGWTEGQLLDTIGKEAYMEAQRQMQAQKEQEELLQEILDISRTEKNYNAR